jgi:hypothetical protein
MIQIPNPLLEIAPQKGIDDRRRVWNLELIWNLYPCILYLFRTPLST